MWRVAVGMIATREESISIRELAIDAERRPSPSTIRALVAAGRGRPWLPSIVDALAEVGIVASEEILGD